MAWKVKAGDTVKINDVIVEIETAKSLVELPCPYAGTSRDCSSAEGETVDVGTPIIAVETGEPARCGAAAGRDGRSRRPRSAPRPRTWSPPRSRTSRSSPA